MDRPFDNRLLALTFGGSATAAGFAGVFVPQSTSFVLTQAFPGLFLELWFVGLMLSGVATLVGQHMNRVEGPIIAGVGLGVGGCFLTSYGILLMTVAGWSSFTAASFVTSLAVACFVRAYRIHILISNVRTSLRTKGG